MGIKYPCYFNITVTYTDGQCCTNSAHNEHFSDLSLCFSFSTVGTAATLLLLIDLPGQATFVSYLFLHYGTFSPESSPLGCPTISNIGAHLKTLSLYILFFFFFNLGEMKQVSWWKGGVRKHPVGVSPVPLLGSELSL